MKKHLLPFITALISSMAAWTQVPVINSFTPASGPPGTLVTITGTNLDSITYFTIAGKTALVISDNGSTLVGYVMPGSATGEISVTNAHGNAYSTSNFTTKATVYPTQLETSLVGTGAIGASQQGSSVALSADGTTVAVGGDGDNSEAGAVWIFTRNGNVWTQQAKLPGIGSEFGYALALSADGNTLIVGSFGAGAWIYTRTDTTWSEQATLTGIDHDGGGEYGISVAISADGNTAAVGGPTDSTTLYGIYGAVWVFTRSGTTWTQMGPKLNAEYSDCCSYIELGYSVAISADGNTIFAGAPEWDGDFGAAWLYSRAGNTWTVDGIYVGSGAVFGRTGVYEGSAVALSADGTVALLAGPEDDTLRGAVWVFEGTPSSGENQVGNKLQGKCDALALSADGTVFLTSSTTYESTSIYQNFTLQTGFGYTGGASVAISANGSYAAVGDYQNSSYGGVNIYGPSTPPQGSLTANGLLCGSGIGQLTFTASQGSGPYTIVYNNGNTDVTVTDVNSGSPFNVSPDTLTTTTTYTLISVTGSNDSVTTSGFTVDTAIIIVSPIPTASIAGTTTGCGSVSLNSSGGTGYLWSGGSSANTASDTFTVSGTYFVTVTNAGNCTASASQDVTVNPIPSAAITASGPTTFCAGDSVTLTVPSAASYLWSNNATTQSINVNQAGSYTVAVTNANNCSAVSLATRVTVNSLPNSTITADSSTTFCAGDSVTLTASSGTAYLWSNDQTTQSIIVKQGGSYTVEVSNANCSATSAPAVITVDSLPASVITASGDTVFCQGNSITLMAGAGAAYLWSNNSTTQSIDVTQSGNYTVMITNGNNCSALSNPVSVTVNLLPAVTITPATVTFCDGGNATLVAGGGINYAWSNSANTSSTLVTPTTTTTYTVTVTGNDGCSDTASRIVTVYPMPDATLTPSGNLFVCAGDSVTLSAPVGNPGYLWSNNATTQSVSIKFNGYFSVTITDANNCSAASAPDTVTVNPLPAVPVITQAGTTLTSTTAVSYQWYLDGSLLNGDTLKQLSITENGQYQVEIADSNGCTSISAVFNATGAGIGQIVSEFGVKLYPNPNNGNFTIEFTDDATREIEITDAVGRTIVSSIKVERQKNFTLNDLASGIYILKVIDRSTSEILTQKVVVAH